MFIHILKYFVVFLLLVFSIASLINTNLKGDALEHAINTCGAKHLFLGTAHQDTFEKSPAARLDGLTTWLHAPQSSPDGGATANQSINAKSGRSARYDYTPCG